MQIIKITPRYLKRFVDGTGPTQCPACPHPIEPGQYVVHHHFEPLDFAQTDVHIHVACIRALVEDTPEDLVAPAEGTAAADARQRRALAGIAEAQRAA